MTFYLMTVVFTLSVTIYNTFAIEMKYDLDLSFRMSQGEV